jgi:hypothetical protein
MGIQTPGDLKAFLWKRLPMLRKHAVGKDQVSDLVDAVLVEFPERSLGIVKQGGHDQGLIEEQLLQSVKRHYCLARGEDEHNVGMIWTLIVLNVASAIIAEIVKWWWANADNRDQMARWKNLGRKRNG